MLVDPHALARALGAPPPASSRATRGTSTLRASTAAPAGSGALESLWARTPTSSCSSRAPGGAGLVPYPRWAAAYGVSYAFSQQVARATPIDAAPAPARRRELRRWESVLRPLRGGGGAEPAWALNGALLNWYDGELGHYIGRHADDERQLAAHAPIVSLSFGAPRRFRFTRAGADWAKHEKVVVELGDGDALVMGGQTQRTHKHEIMKLRQRDPRGRRVNLTLRAFAVAPPDEVDDARCRERAAEPERASAKRARVGEAGA